MRTVGVRVLDIPYHADIEYTYYVPEGMPEVCRGSFLLVPFGFGNKKIPAVATSVSKTTDYSKIKPVFKVYTDGIRITEKMMRLAEFLCGRTFCSFGEAVKRLVPSDLIPHANEYFAVREDAPKTAYAKRHAATLAYIAEHGAVSREKLMRETGITADVINRMLGEGLIEKQARSAVSGGAYTTLVFPAENADPAVLEKPRTPQAHVDLYCYVCECGIIEKKTLLAEGFTPSQISAVEKKGLIRTEKQEIIRNPYKDIPKTAERPALSAEQAEAKKKLLALADGKPHAALLYGVTGSGKTSVILELCEDIVKQGRQAIVLVPEIALTWQSVSLFAGRFGERLAVMHSSLSEGEKADTFKRISRGEVDVALGTRSALFAPFENLGLIVIDEEQEHTYKSDMSPKYHARDVARFLCAEHGALFVPASATPSVETYYRAKSGTYSLVKLSARYGKAVMPRVLISDLRENLIAASEENIGSELACELEENLAGGFQSILFLNRRGYNSYFSCHACGEAVLCPNCSVTMTYHVYKKSNADYLQCHYCGVRMPTPRLCPACGSEHIAGGGFGTQKIEEELSRRFPAARLLRLDADTTRTKFSQDKILSDFREGKADILIGTQMVTKGHNFPRVTLVGVVNADNSLFMNDFHSGERTFSVVTQVVGRAGRGEHPGRALIQTRNPENETLLLSAEQNYEKFYESEIVMRKNFVFPPFCDIALVGFSSAEEACLATFAEDFGRDLRETHKKDFSDIPIMIFGPFDAPVYKIGGKFRKQIIIKHKNNARTRELFALMLRKHGKTAGGKIGISIDINPSNI
ncbi:MAG: primosomal protein N' [Clostridia bacterium]|nr:primosomal protein N' [Clostridia bacterium]